MNKNGNIPEQLFRDTSFYFFFEYQSIYSRHMKKQLISMVTALFSIDGLWRKSENNC